MEQAAAQAPGGHGVFAAAAVRSAMSPSRLARIDDMANAFVDSGRLPCVAGLVWRRGEIVSVVARGWADVDRRKPVARDTIFRIASMTKPIISVAALMLLEEGRLALSDPLSRWLPEAAGTRVLRHPDAELDDTVPLDRPPTLHDLITHTAGFASSLGIDPAPPVTRAMAEASGRTAATSYGPDEFAARVCRVPLMFQPGQRWFYGISTDLLGVVVARAAGMALDRWLDERIFQPLGMGDTGFHVPPDRQHRLATGYGGNPGEALQPIDLPETGRWSRPPAFPSGGGGLVSTLDDYLAFARMLLAGGKWDGERFLSRPALEMLTAPQLTPEQARPVSPELDILAGRNFGLGVGLYTGAGPQLGSARKYGWPGAYATDWFNDPAEDLIGIVMSQLWFGGAELRPVFANAVYQAIED